MLLYYIKFFDINRSKSTLEHNVHKEVSMSKSFLTCYNNGTTAVVLEDDLKKLGVTENLLSLGPKRSGIKVFTFCSARRMQEDPHARRIFTGDMDFMHRLLQGHRVSESYFYVPFSNGAERGVHGTAELDRELEWCTTAQDVVDTFLS